MGPRGEREPSPPLDPLVVGVMRKLATHMAERYAHDFLLGRLRRSMALGTDDLETVTAGLENPYFALRAFFGHYAYARRGKDRDEIASLSNEALSRLVSERGMDDVLTAPDGVALWTGFETLCKERGRKSLEAQNRGPVQGMLELAQEIHRLGGGLSLATWVVDGVERTGRLEPQHLRIVDIRGVGPKSASTFLRDMVWLFDVEERVDPSDRIFLQPVDRWLRAVVQYVVPEPDLEEPADWIVAGKIAKYTRRAGVSGAGFNMGVTYFGQRVVGKPEAFADALRALASASARPPYE